MAKIKQVYRRRLAQLSEAADYAACSKWTIRRRIADGQLRAFRNGRMIVVDLDDVDAMLRPVPSAGGDGA